MPLLLMMRNLVGKKGLTNLLVYALLADAAHVVAGRLRASRLEGQLARAQLAALRQKLHPHFLFNALHTLSELIHHDAHAADRMVTRLGDLLRATLDAEDRPMASRVLWKFEWPSYWWALDHFFLSTSEDAAR